ncbi:hypothetical protein AO498_12082 [Algoriphagus sanaruensis]|uniref:Uncharacterized protein n=1 Tax=Algoriphagus sanaruensis TaxID=1727163 RepID=A0A142EPX3_9BACT|nr:hypothetical protein AO498_12082 [Algoriphagus sanaruensis]
MITLVELEMIPVRSGFAQFRIGLSRNFNVLMDLEKQLNFLLQLD